MPDSYGADLTFVRLVGLTTVESATMPTAFTTERASRISSGRYDLSISFEPRNPEFVKSFTCTRRPRYGSRSWGVKRSSAAVFRGNRPRGAPCASRAAERGAGVAPTAAKAEQ